MKISFLWVTLIIVSLLLLPTIVGAQPPIQLTTEQSGEGGWEEFESPPLPPDTLWNQSSAENVSVVSQYFPDLGGGIFSADDFRNSHPWNIKSIFVDGFWSSLTQADSLHWLIYPDASGVPAGYPGDGSGAELWSHTCLPTDPEVTLSGAGSDQVTLDVVKAQGASLCLPPGTYWLVFYPSLNLGLYGQWYWDAAVTSHLTSAQVIDPNDLFLLGYTSWTPWPVINPTIYDAAFRLEGNAVTPPGGVGGEAYPVNKLGILAPWIALIAAIIAGAGLLVLRRRRA